MKIIKKLDLIHVPVIYTGMYDVKAIQAAVDMKMKKSAYSTHENSLEGYVIRNTEGFNLESYSENVGKYVFPQYRDAHNAQGEEWLYKVGKPNILVRY
jgi:hypothetical protein